MIDEKSKQVNQEKSVSAIENLCSSRAAEGEKPEEGMGVPIQNFDSLMEHMTTMNIKFLN